MYDGSDTSATLLGTFCGANIPTVLTSGDKNLYIVYTSTEASNSFNAPWKKVASKLEMKYIINTNKTSASIFQKFYIFIFSNLLCHGVGINRQL